MESQMEKDEERMEKKTYATMDVSPSTPFPSLLALASPTRRSNSFKWRTAFLSETISSNSALALSSTFAFSCRHTLSRLAGTWRAGVGKQLAKFA